MKFSVDSAGLTDSVNWVSRSLSTRPIMTALLGIVIDAQKDVTLSASDLETSAKSSFNAEIKEPGRVLVPGRLLTEISKALPNKTVTFQLEGSRVLVTAGSAKFTLPTLPLNEYPNLPNLPETSGTIASELFATAVNQVAVAAGRDDSLPTLTGIHIDITKETITLAATDRYRLAVREINWTPNDPELTTTALLRARTLADAARTIANTKNVSISIAPTSNNERLVGFASDAKTMTSRQLDGSFPPYRHLLPSETSANAVIEVAKLLDSVRRVALVTDKTVPLRLKFNNNTLQLEAGAGDEAQATEELEINYNGEAIDIAFNPTFLTDGLSALGTAYVNIAFTGSNKPAMLTGKSKADGSADTSFRYLLMPMRYAS
ncbi:MAG: DNA polymerase III subunit beta [Actinomycetales bacterium]|nr:DNA polymerase III subunit beta [Actinomycetales bacterium]